MAVGKEKFRLRFAVVAKGGHIELEINESTVIDKELKNSFDTLKLSSEGAKQAIEKLLELLL